VGKGTAQLFGTHRFVGYGFDDVWSGNKHVGSFFHHEDKIRDCGGVNGSTGAWPHDGRYLRHHPGGHNISVKDVGIPAQGIDAFLNTCPTGVV